MAFPFPFLLGGSSTGVLEFVNKVVTVLVREVARNDGWARALFWDAIWRCGLLKWLAALPKV